MGPRFQLEQNQRNQIFVEGQKLALLSGWCSRTSREKVGYGRTVTFFGGYTFTFFWHSDSDWRKTTNSYQNHINPGDFEKSWLYVNLNPLSPPCSRSPRSVEFESPTHSVAAPQQRHVELLHEESVGDSTENSWCIGSKPHPGCQSGRNTAGLYV